jgi:hypothetical protein
MFSVQLYLCYLLNIVIIFGTFAKFIPTASPLYCLRTPYTSLAPSLMCLQSLADDKEYRRALLREVSPPGTAAGADLGGSSKYSREGLEG